MDARDFDVIVLGLGIMGVATCETLTRRGAKVLGLEQFDLGHDLGSSHGESRIIRQAYFEHPDYVPLLRRSYQLWKELGAAHGETYYHEVGLLYGLHPGGSIARGLNLSAARHGVPLVSVASLGDRSFGHAFVLPHSTDLIYEREAGLLTAEPALRSLARAASARGANLRSRARVLDFSSDEASVRVRTEDRTYRADRLIITSGAWAGPVLPEISLPLRVVQKSMFWFPATGGLAEGGGAPCFFFETPAGLFYGFPERTELGPGVKVAEHSGGVWLNTAADRSPHPPAAELRRAQEFVSGYLKGVTTRPLRSKTCLYTMTPDENFIIDQHPRHPRITFATGFSGHGFKFAPVIGEILADLSTTDRTPHPIDFLRLRSF